MNYLTDKEIHEICREYLIKNYTINTDGSIDVDGDFVLYRDGLTKLPIKFNHVSGYFYCLNISSLNKKGTKSKITRTNRMVINPNFKTFAIIFLCYFLSVIFLRFVQ